MYDMVVAVEESAKALLCVGKNVPEFTQKYLVSNRSITCNLMYMYMKGVDFSIQISHWLQKF